MKKYTIQQPKFVKDFLAPDLQFHKKCDIMKKISHACDCVAGCPDAGSSDVQQAEDLKTKHFQEERL